MIMEGGGGVESFCMFAYRHSCILVMHVCCFFFAACSSDFMERYFDAYDADTSDLHYGMTTVYSEVKREGTQHSN